MATTTSTTQTFHIRPVRLRDIPDVVDIFTSSFGGDQLMRILFPNMDAHPEVFATRFRRLFYTRWWTPNYDMHLAAAGDDDDDVPVGFACWSRPDSQLSFYQRWLSPFPWISRIVRAYFSLRDWLSPIPNLDEHAAGALLREMQRTIGPDVIDAHPRRRDAWYLSSIAIRPSLQGRGIGTLILRHGLRKADSAGAASWLISLAGREGYYANHGFREVARANRGELARWEGGSIMFRGE